MKSVFYQRLSLETFYSATTQTGHVEADYPITTFLKTKDSQIFYANGLNNIHKFEGCFLRGQVSFQWVYS